MGRTRRAAVWHETMGRQGDDRAFPDGPREEDEADRLRDRRMNAIDLSTAVPRDRWWGRIIRAPLALIPENAVLPVLQGPGRGLRWIAGASNHGCWLGTYELRQTQMFANRIDSGNVVYDIGAHVGWYSMIASRLVGDTGHVVAFEPHPPNVSYLRRHIELNSASNVAVVPAAVSASDGTAAFLPGASRTTGRLSGPSSDATSVRTISVDSLVEAGEAPPPDVIKIDVEGHEKDVLVGAQRTLVAERPIFFVSTHGRDARHQCVELLRSEHFRVRPIGTEKLDSASAIVATPMESE